MVLKPRLITGVHPVEIVQRITDTGHRWVHRRQNDGISEVEPKRRREGQAGDEIG